VREVTRRRFGVQYSEVDVWRPLGKPGFSSRKPERLATVRVEAAVARWKNCTLLALKNNASKKALKLSTSTSRVCTWAPIGLTPVVYCHFKWKQLSVTAGLSLTDYRFRLHEGAIHSPKIVQFLQVMRRHLQQALLIFWDGLKTHSSRQMRTYMAGKDGAIELANLPPYAPNLNPVE
jgi:hypothetical protein